VKLTPKALPICRQLLRQRYRFRIWTIPSMIALRSPAGCHWLPRPAQVVKRLDSAYSLVWKGPANLDRAPPLAGRRSGKHCAWCDKLRPNAGF